LTCANVFTGNHVFGAISILSLSKFSFPFLPFRFLNGYRTLAEGRCNTSIDTSKKNNNIKKLTPPVQWMSGGVREI
jgi:hypothetical protein